MFDLKYARSGICNVKDKTPTTPTMRCPVEEQLELPLPKPEVPPLDPGSLPQGDPGDED